MECIERITDAMQFADLSLSRRLERAEGHACAQFAESRRRLYPASAAMWMECAGAYAVFDGVDSPLTQSFGLGLFEPLTPASLDGIERFFLDRGASVLHEVSPLARVAALQLLCARRYRPAEISNVLYRPVEKPPASDTAISGCGLRAPKKRNCGVASVERAGPTNIPNSRIFFSKSARSLRPVRTLCASSPKLTTNRGPLECCRCTTEWRYSVVWPPFRNCAVVDCKQRFSRSVCATPSTRGATWP